MKKRVTLQDLAKELNTTASTVSRALKDHEGISTKMRKKVKDLAIKRNYRLNTMASSLRTGQNKTIGIIVPAINRDFFSNVISGIEKVASANGYNLIICQSHNNLEDEIKNINTLIRSSVAGIFVSLGLKTTNYNHFQYAIDQGFPLIFFDRVPLELDATKIVVDDFNGAYKATEHLIEMGYKRIAHFGGNDKINIYKNRKDGYLKALKDNGIKKDTSIILKNTLNVELGTEAIEKLINSDNPPDAVFAASDYSALGAFTWLVQNNIKVPQQVGVVGFGNEKFTSLMCPNLSTVNQFSLGMGKFAAEVFFDEYINKDFKTPKKIQLAAELIIRESSFKKKE